MNASDLTTLLGWSSLLNIGFLTLTSAMLLLLPDRLVAIHQRLLGLQDEDWRRVYIQFMSNYKIAVLVFNISPYLALKCMGY